MSCNELSDETKKSQACNDASPMSELKSLMEAEQELSAIFSKGKDASKFCSYSNLSNNQIWSPDKNCSLSTNELSE